MSESLDQLDRKILTALQDDASRSLEDLAQIVGSSKTPVWNRIRKLRERGVIQKQVAVIDPKSVGYDSCFFVLVRTAQHSNDWLEQFVIALEKYPEVIEAHRLAGDVDYILKVQVRDSADYDRFYRSLVSDVSLFNVTSLLSMEQILFRNAIPV